MVVKVRKIGNSAGVLLSKRLLEQCSIKEEVSLEIIENAIIIKPVVKVPREGWEAQFLDAGSLYHHELMFDEISNSFDKDKWTW